MRRISPGIASVFSVAVAVILLGAIPAHAATEINGAVATGILVSYRSDGVSTQSIGGEQGGSVIAGLSDKGISVKGEVSEAHGQTTVVAQPLDGKSIEEAISDALEVEGVTAAQPDYVYESVGGDEGSYGVSPEAGATGVRLQALSGFDDPIAQVRDGTDASVPNQYWLYTAGLAEAWSDMETNRAVTVAVLDTAIDVNHEDLSANVLTSRAYDAFDRQVFDMSTADLSTDGGHATHVAGIIAGVANNARGIAGGSYNANILPVMVVRNGTGGTSSVLAGLDYIRTLVESGNADNIRVINMSIRLYTARTDGSTPSLKDEAIEEAMAALREDGVAIVCAGGNYRTGRNMTDYSYPADSDEAVAVTALDVNNGNYSGSEYNEHKDISAPGVSVWSTWNTSGTYGPYYVESGTSMAAPMVSATFALLFADYPSATVDEACDAIYSTAKSIRYTTSEDDLARQNLSGTHGALSANDALQYLEDNYGPHFTDVARQLWSYHAVWYVANRNIMSGYDNGTFGPADPVTREQMARVLYNYEGNDAIAEPCPQSDVIQGSWYASAANWAVATRVMDGYSDEEFGVGDKLTREQLAVVIARVAGADLGSASRTAYDSLLGTEEASDWAESSLVWAADEGVINGETDDAGNKWLDPKGTVTREQMAQVFANAIQNGVL